MEKKDLLKKVGLIVRELTEQYQYLSESPENLNDLELELFLANANFLTDHIEILRKINGSGRPTSVFEEIKHETANRPASAAPGSEAKVEEEPVHTPVEQSKSASITQPIQAPAAEEQPVQPQVFDEKPQSKGPDEIREEQPGHLQSVPENNIANGEETTHQAENNKLESDNAGQAIKAAHDEVRPDLRAAPEVSESGNEEVVKEVVIPEKTISVEAPAAATEPATVPTINEMISAGVAPSTVGNRFTSHPVADLKSIISLNDKLLFVKDLFDGYSLAYSEAIELLNRFESFDAADNFLKTNYAEKNNWHEKQPAVDKLYAALNRRFTK